MKIKLFDKKPPGDTSNLSMVLAICPGCNGESAGEVCMHCGEKLYPKRITVHKILKDVPDVFFDVDSGLFYTMRTFFTHPGREIKRYFAGNRNRHYKPLKYVLFIGGITTFIYAKYPITNGQPQTAFEAFGMQWNSLILLLQMPLIAAITWLVFKKQQFTYGEHLVANSYIIAQVSLFNIALFPFRWLLNGRSIVVVFDAAYLLFVVAYYSYAFYDWFYNRKGKSGIVLSIVLTLCIFLVVLIFTIIVQVALFFAFAKLGWT